MPKSLLSDLECLLEDATAALQTENGHLSPLSDKESVDGLEHQECNGEIGFVIQLFLFVVKDMEEMASSHLQEPEVTDYAALMGIMYSMVKQDCDAVINITFLLQDKIVASLSLMSSSGELESYCLIWSLRPYVNDQIMHLAWKLVP
ncbi:hypothetical protein PTKIN_Ptkin08bG0130000 [Pterospermum kingtungense]